MRRNVVALGIVGPLLMLTCVGVVLVTGAAGWLMLKPAKTARPVKISLLAPLSTPAAQPSAAVSQSSEASPEPLQADAQSITISKQQPAEETSPVQPQVAGNASPVSEVQKVERALGFSLPAGTVNSITRIGIATRLEIPRLNLDAPVTIAPIKNQTWQVDQLGQSIGHLEGTAPPGSNSNIVLAGHVTLAETNGGPGPFLELGNLAPGDEIIVYEGKSRFVYIVDGLQTVDRSAVEVTFPTDTPQITLITCSQWDHNQGRYVERLVVKGRLKRG